MRMLLLCLLLLAPAVPARADSPLDAHHNQPVLILFFSPGSATALQAAKALRKIRKDIPSSKLAMLALAPEGTAQSRLVTFMKAAGLNFPAAVDSEDALAGYSKADGTPFIVLLNKRHRVEDWWPGYHPVYEPMIARAAKSAL